MSERSERMKIALKRIVQLRPLAVTFAMLLMHVASKETTIAGAIDRIIQLVMAYALVAWAMKPNKPPRSIWLRNGSELTCDVRFGYGGVHQSHSDANNRRGDE